MKNRLYLTRAEVQQLLLVASCSRNALRDTCMITLAYIHGLRVSELTGLKITDIDLLSGKIFIRRLKNGFSTQHPLLRDERVLLERWLKIRSPDRGDWLFPGRNGRPLNRQLIYKMISRYGRAAALPLNVHPHMLRHGCGYELAEQGLDTRLIQDYLGHRNIRHTVHYTAGNAARFTSAWSCMGEGEYGYRT